MNRFKFVRDYYCKNNLKVFPVSPNDKTPMASVSWKVIASSDVRDVMDWFEQVPNINIGLPASLNDLFIIDIDENHNNGVSGLENWKKLLEHIGLDSKNVDTLVQKTPSGGFHLIFKSDDELKKVKNVAGAFKIDGFDGIDIRTDGYICVAPSVRDGVGYYYVVDTSPDNFIAGIKTMPTELKNYILECNSKNVVVNNEQIESCDFYREGKIVEKGSRDEEIFKYINYLYRNTKLGYDEVLALAKVYNDRCFNPPLSESVLKYKVDMCFKKERPKIIICKFE